MQTSDNPHYDLIQAQLPCWATHAQPGQWAAMRHTLQTVHQQAGLPADAIANAAPHLREAVEHSWARLKHSQTALARLLKGLQQVAGFAETRLAGELKATGFPHALADCELLRVESTWHWLGLRYTYSHRRSTLVQAALQNFTAQEDFVAPSALALSKDIQVRTVQVEGTVPTGPDGPSAPLQMDSEEYQVTPLSMTPATFAALCRRLDIGAAYQHHLDQHLGNHAVDQAIQAVLRDSLRLAADLAYLRHRLTGAGRDCIAALLEGQPTRCWTVTLFSLPVHEVTLIDAGGAGLLLHLPGHPSTLLQCANLDAVQQQLIDRLLTPEGRAAFRVYLPRDQQAHFLDLLQQNLSLQSDATAHQTWSLQPGATLHLKRNAIDDDPFVFLQKRHVQRVKDEALELAVPTAAVDALARQRRLEQWENYGLNALNLAGFFIPVIGSLMLGVAACQLLGEVVEGVEAWSDGDRHLALQHLEAVGLNVALMGGLLLAGRVLPTLFSSSLMDSLDAVKSTDGQPRLWQPDLVPYRTRVALPEDLAPDEVGLYSHEGRHYLRLDGHLHEVAQTFEEGTWRLLHPTDTEAYQPPLTHNGSGAWHLPFEQPQAWSSQRLLRRLYPHHATLSDTDLDSAVAISGTSAQTLREVFIAGKPTPMLLTDTLARIEAIRAGAGLQALDAVELSSLAPARSSEVPLARAMEGLYFPARANLDSHRLWLACLRRLPGWPQRLRLEIRDASPTGAVLAATGDAQAENPLMLLKTERGYEGYREERPVVRSRYDDPGRALLDTLSSRQRQALGTAGSDTEGLRRALLTIAGRDRMEWPARLWGPQAERPSFGLRGGDPWRGDLRTFIRTPQARRYLRLYPNASEMDYRSQLRTWRQQGLSPSLELDRLEGRLQALRRDLNTWANRVPRRERASVRVQAAWQRASPMRFNDTQTVYDLDLSALELEDQDLQSLALPEEFTHIGELRLSHNTRLSQIPAALLERLPGLRRMILSRCSFQHIPEVAEPARLEWLDLDHNALTWTPPAQATLDAMSNLGVLDLSDNPLLEAPDLSQLPRLRTVYMTRCQLRTTPAGLPGLQAPLLLDFSENPLREIVDVSAIPVNVASTLSLESLTLGEQALAQADRYFQTTGVDLLVPDVDYEDLFAGAVPAQITLWRRLPLAFRRELRGLLASTDYVDNQSWAREETWRRLARMDQDPLYRTRVLAQAADRLLELPLEYT
ncbi:leucine-rich repeat domain-containing protein [Pseudomonas putida]|uniref:Leucine-rich repeat domain-containing protein n=1 Tax=Pseudomonas putida TaxID=303 RepID=A0A4D6X8Q2_PSEPU|nr:leucine-rich repeat domain-containing protein [Pseudomonas putida]QCI12602.1 leucine-rich repeat domain-containing protein [Pseudomonas putida]